MKIYFEMLCYILSDIVCLEHYGSPQSEIQVLRYTDMPLAGNNRAAYILNPPAADIPAFSKAAAAKGVHPLNVFILSETAKDYGNCFSAFGDTDNLALIQVHGGTSAAVEQIEDAFAMLVQWESLFNEKLLNGTDMDEFLSLGKTFLKNQYFLFDRDLNPVYNSDEALFSSGEFSELLSQGLFNSMISDKKFHDAVNEAGLFYYENIDGKTSACRNVTIDGEYIARIVMLMPDGQTRLHPGGEMIFDIFCDYANKAFDLGRYTLERHSNDLTHRILKDIAKGKNFPRNTLDTNLGSLLKGIPGAYTVTVFRFYSDDLWPVHLATTLPYMAVTLEKSISGSIAAASDSEIIMLNGFAGDENHNTEFLQQVASFIRENLCKAGISPVFDVLTDINSAVNSARAALDLGSLIKPHLWYYLFDDYRLDYIINSSTEDISAGFLCHPAVRILEKYDSANDTMLNQTLRVYLENHLNMTKAADEIFIHRTSFFHRINRIKELTMVDLEDPRTVLELMISYEMRGLK